MNANGHDSPTLWGGSKPPRPLRTMRGKKKRRPWTVPEFLALTPVLMRVRSLAQYRAVGAWVCDVLDRKPPGRNDKDPARVRRYWYKVYDNLEHRYVTVFFRDKLDVSFSLDLVRTRDRSRLPLTWFEKRLAWAFNRVRNGQGRRPLADVLPLFDRNPLDVGVNRKTAVDPVTGRKIYSDERLFLRCRHRCKKTFPGPRPGGWVGLPGGRVAAAMKALADLPDYPPPSRLRELYAELRAAVDADPNNHT